MYTILSFSDKYIPDIREWLRARDLPLHVIDELPSYGLIAIDEEGPICAAFLRLVEGKFALFDGLITNPSIDAVTRDRALNALTAEMTKGARDLGLKKILGLTVDEHTIIRAKGHGYVRLPYTIMSLSLGG